MLGKIFAGFVGARIAEQSGKSGLLGATSGLVFSRIARRSPLGAMVIGGAWLGRKLYQRNKEREFDRAARNAKPVAPAGPVKKAAPKGTGGTAPTASPSSAPSSTRP